MAKTKGKKSYTPAEEEFLKACVKIGVQNNLTNASIASNVHEMLGRSQKAVALQLGFAKQRLNEEEEERVVTYKEEINEIKEILLETIRKEKNEESTPVPISTPPVLENIQGSVERETEIKEEKPKKLEPLGEERLGDKVLARVYNIMPFGAFCETEEGKTSLIIKSMISSDFVEDISDYLQVGDAFEAIVVKDKHNEGRVLLNARAVGDIIPVKERNNVSV